MATLRNLNMPRRRVLEISALVVAIAGNAFGQTAPREHSFMGGVFHRSARGAQAQDSQTQNMPDCSQIAKMPNSVISMDACEKMMNAQKSYNAALSDPSASRPGDEQMSCEQILTELHQQTYAVPDKATVADLQVTAKTEQTTVFKQQAEINAIAAKQSAEIAAASNVDRVSEAATMGVVRPNTAGKLAEKFQKENRVTGERMAQERKPTETKLVNSTADLATDTTLQLRSNPRMAKLVQLASARHCKGG